MDDTFLYHHHHVFSRFIHINNFGLVILLHRTTVIIWDFKLHTVLIKHYSIENCWSHGSYIIDENKPTGECVTWHMELSEWFVYTSSMLDMFKINYEFTIFATLRALKRGAFYRGTSFWRPCCLENCQIHLLFSTFSDEDICWLLLLFESL